MPTLAKPQLIETPSPWRTESDRFLQELCRKGVPILARLNYYAERDLPVPEADQLEVLVQDEEIELKRIAGALSFAAAASEDLPDGIVIATLRQVSRNPSLLRLGGLPAAVEWEIARNYQRRDEEQATHWPDVWGDQPLFEGLVEVPTDANIVRARLRQSPGSKEPENAGDRTIPQIKCSRIVWAKSTAKVVNRSLVIGVPTRATAS